MGWSITRWPRIARAPIDDSVAHICLHQPSIWGLRPIGHRASGGPQFREPHYLCSTLSTLGSPKQATPSLRFPVALGLIPITPQILDRMDSETGPLDEDKRRPNEPYSHVSGPLFERTLGSHQEDSQATAGVVAQREEAGRLPRDRQKMQWRRESNSATGAGGGKSLKFA